MKRDTSALAGNRPWDTLDLLEALPALGVTISLRNRKLYVTGCRSLYVAELVTAHAGTIRAILEARRGRDKA